MGHVFISYKTEERETARKLRLALRAELRDDAIWWDQDLQTGGQWSQEIDAKLSSAACVVVLWSKLSVQSQWVQQEAAVAKALGILVPAKIDSCAIPTPYAGIQAASLVNWQGNETDPEFAKLLARVKACLGNHSSGRPAASPLHSPPIAQPNPTKGGLSGPAGTGSKPSIRTTVENHIVVWTLGTLLAGFMAGFGTYAAILKIAQLEPVRSSTIKQLEDEIENLEKEKAAAENKVATAQLDHGTKETEVPGVLECGENENCDGIVIACQASGDRPSDVTEGKWLYGPNSEEFKKNLQGFGRTGAIEYGAWSNPGCDNLSGSGWHAKVGTCNKGTPGNPGWQRCVNVKVISPR